MLAWLMLAHDACLRRRVFRSEFGRVLRSASSWGGEGAATNLAKCMARKRQENCGIWWGIDRGEGHERQAHERPLAGV